MTEWKGRRSTDKSYPGDNRLILPKSSHRRQGLAPRCRLVASWGWSRSQGLGCSPIKAVRELGLERKLHCVLLQKCSTRNPTISAKPDRTSEQSEGNAEGRRTCSHRSR